jgi:Ion channel
MLRRWWRIWRRRLSERLREARRCITSTLRSLAQFIFRHPFQSFAYLGLSLTRAIADWLKTPNEIGSRELKEQHKGDWLRFLSLFWLSIEVVLALLLIFRPISMALIYWWCLISWFRINEIVFAFYGDAIDRVRNQISQSRHLKNGTMIRNVLNHFQSRPVLKMTSDLESWERIRMAMRSYYGLIFNFAVLYSFLPVFLNRCESLWDFVTDCSSRASCKLADCTLIIRFFEEGKVQEFFDLMYFSSVTIATLGYGDVSPTHWISRFLSVYEVIAGVLLVVVAIGTYIGGETKIDVKRPLWRKSKRFVTSKKFTKK